MPLGDGAHTGQADVRERLEVGLTDLKMDDVSPAGLQLLRAGQNLIRAFGFKMGSTLGKVHHSLLHWSD